MGSVVRSGRSALFGGLRYAPNAVALALEVFRPAWAAVLVNIVTKFSGSFVVRGIRG